MAVLAIPSSKRPITKKRARGRLLLLLGQRDDGKVLLKSSNEVAGALRHAQSLPLPVVAAAAAKVIELLEL